MMYLFFGRNKRLRRVISYFFHYLIKLNRVCEKNFRESFHLKKNIEKDQQRKVNDSFKVCLYRKRSAGKARDRLIVKVI